MSAAARVWEGNDALEPLLVELAELHPHPRNPRRGATEEIRASLRRFGQQRPLLALPDGTIVAGHHVWAAADAEGWSHLAVVRSDLADREVDAYLVADNRLSDLGFYDDRALADILEQVSISADGLAGTGYADDELRDLLAGLAGPVAPGEFGEVDPTGEHRCPRCGYEWSGQAAPEVG